MPYRLSALKLNRVDLVPDGSNPGAEIVLFKSKEGKRVNKKQAQKKTPVKKTPPKADSRSKSKQRGDEDEEEEEDDDAVTKSEDDEDDDDEEIEKDADDDEEENEDDEEEEVDEDDDVKKGKGKGKGKEKKSVKKTDKKNTAKFAADDDNDELDGIGDDDDDDDVEEIPESVMKALAPGARRAIEKQNRLLAKIRKDAKEARELVAVEKDKRVTLEFIEKAKKDIPDLTGTDEEKGTLLKALYSGAPVAKKMADSIVKLLKTGNAAVHSMLMSETGSRHARSDEEQDAVDELREKAAEIQKSDKKLTKEQAFEKACQDNPDLWRQYKVEKRRQSARMTDIN